tara:strand:+ start:222 stop:680 length:459 start_codon:yes stop_codon:yes gene_type:complete
LVDKKTNNDIHYISGDSAVDDRGKLNFCNDFDMKAVRRFYTVSNHSAQFIRAWHGHEYEAKFVYVASGAAMLAAVKIDNWKEPSKNLEISKFFLSEEKPGVLHIPSGYAHGSMTLKSRTQIVFFSTSTLTDSIDDDMRYPYNYWDPWTVLPR